MPQIIRLQTLDSTNRYLKERADRENWEEGTVVITEHQTSGRGQQGNLWESESGKNLLFSLLIGPDFLSIQQHFLLSKIVALAVRESILAMDTTLSCSDFFVKWPNDIYYHNKKMAGILIENEITNDKITRSVIGIGINVNQEKFRSNAPNPISLKQIIQKETDLNQLLNSFLQRFQYWYENLKNGKTEDIRRTYFQSLYNKEGIRFYEDKNGRFAASIQSVGDNGLLHLLTDGGEERVYAFKEVRQVN